jgi:hypothetical protein
LPFGASGFPAVRAEEVVARMNALFDLGGDDVFLASLAAFNDVAGFSAGSAVLFAAERAVNPGANIADLTRSDAAAFSSTGVPLPLRFDGFDPGARSRYLELWERSAFIVRRRFFSSVRAITFVAFYSMPKVWPSIGYAGPLVRIP